MRYSNAVRAIWAGGFAILALAGCGEPDDGGSDTSADVGSDRPAEGGPSAVDHDFTLDDPVTIVMAIQAEGSSDPNRVPDFEDGLRLAVADINAQGGIGGQEVSYEVVDTPSTPPDEAVRSLELAFESDPAAVIGFPSSPQVTAIAPVVRSGEVPVVNLSGEPSFAREGDNGSAALFTARALNPAGAAAAARFALDELDPEKVGILAVSTTYGTDSAAVIEEIMEEAGVEVVANRQVDPAAADLTGEVLDMRDADVVFNFTFPNQIALALTTMAQNGIDAPTIGGASTPPVVTQDLADPSVTGNLYAAVDCLPAQDERDHVRDWAARFEEEYGYPASLQSAQAYDAARFVFEAIVAAESQEHADVLEAMSELTMAEPVCGTDKGTTGDNVLNRSQVVVSYAEDEPTIAASYDDPVAG